MNLNLKKTFFEILNLKYFWIYMLIFAIFSVLGSLIDDVKSIPHNKFISFIPMIFTYISLAFLAVMSHIIINNKDLNNENEPFKTNFLKCLKVGFKTLVAMGLNTFSIMIVEFILIFLAVVLFVVANPGITQNETMKTPLLFVLITFLTLSALIIIFFVFNLAFIKFSKNYSIKDSFKWIQTLKTFFKKGFAQKTSLVLGFQILYQVFVFCFSIILLFASNYSTSLLFNNISENFILPVYLLLKLFEAIVQLAVYSMNFIIFAIVYNILANIYKESCEQTDLTPQTED